MIMKYPDTDYIRNRYYQRVPLGRSLTHCDRMMVLEHRCHIVS